MAPLAPRGLGAGLAILACLAAPDCGRGSSGGGSGATTATVSLTAKTGAPGNVDCTARIVWTLTPRTLTGTTGSNTAVTHDRDYSVHATSDAPGTWVCYFREPIGGLRVGTWAIEARTGTWTATCEQPLDAGQNLVNFTVGRAGCLKGLGFPGD